MTLKLLFVSGCAAAVMAALAVPVMGAAVHECVPGKTTAASYTWDFKAEANTIFQDLEILARQARNNADELNTFDRGSGVDWETQAAQLNTLRDEVNEMGTRLCRLEQIRRVLAPWQQAEVDRIAQSVQLMADNTDDAIVFLDAHQDELWLPAYQKYGHNLYKDSDSLAESLGNAVTYANVSKEYRDLRHKLEMPASS
jgi:hypothetical protein